MTIYKERRHTRLWIWMAAAVTFVATLTLLWTDAQGVL